MRVAFLLRGRSFKGDKLVIARCDGTTYDISTGEKYKQHKEMLEAYDMVLTYQAKLPQDNAVAIEYDLDNKPLSYYGLQLNLEKKPLYEMDAKEYGEFLLDTMETIYDKRQGVYATRDYLVRKHNLPLSSRNKATASLVDEILSIPNKGAEPKVVNRALPNLTLEMVKNIHANKTIDVSGIDIAYGNGGVHGARQGIYRSDKKVQLYDIDAYSMYPSIGLYYGYFNNATIPNLKEYTTMFYDRLDGKSKIDKSISKTVLNIASGLMGSRFHKLSNVEIAQQLRKTGQLLITDLIVLLAKSLENFEIYFANTDGIIISTTSEFVTVDTKCREWQEGTMLKLKVQKLNQAVIKDSTNYIREYENGELKCKGAAFKHENYGNDPIFSMNANNDTVNKMRAYLLTNRDIVAIDTKTPCVICGNSSTEIAMDVEGEDFVLTNEFVQACKVYMVDEGTELYGLNDKKDCQTVAKNVSLTPAENRLYLAQAINEVTNLFGVSYSPNNTDYNSINCENNTKNEKITVENNIINKKIQIKKEEFSMAEKQEKNVYQRLLEARELLLKAPLKQSGENKYSNFKYYELLDLVPTITSVFSKVGLIGIFNMDREFASLQIINLANTDERIEFTAPATIDYELKATNKVQVIGATQTYMRRYLYITALDIIENDSVDAPINESLKAPAVKEKPKAKFVSEAKNQEIKEKLTSPKRKAEAVTISSLKRGIDKLMSMDASKYKAFCNEVQLNLDTYDMETATKTVQKMAQMVRSEEANNG